MKVLVCGDRNWTNKKLISEIISILFQKFGELIIIQGEANGADTLGKSIALENNYQCLGFPAKWNLYGRSAGPIRNTQMLEEGKPDLIIAFHNNITASKGTFNMLLQAAKYHVPVTLFSEKDSEVERQNEIEHMLSMFNKTQS